MVFSSVEALSPFINLAMAALFLGTLFYLVRLNEKVTAMRGAQSELRTLLRACSDQVDGAEKAITTMRGVAQQLAGDLGRSLEEADRMKTAIDATTAEIAAMLARLEAGAAAVTAQPNPASPQGAKRGKPGKQVPPQQRGPARPAAALDQGDRAAALRLFRETFRAL
ncbi:MULTISPECIES: DUF6468 domain-containing protein [unclassified Azospirillum]|uniref:DUF6468 domain-containing protein n=1 Tax=unclassified Azospirillum TaxID=2630922 RepID=UPI000B728A73|nr:MULTISPECIES: DUF6468 domain-containing protein [unclassified Azospirillum]SNS44929.1 hypothetical protein SAMN05880556_10529 [Azospirillum sp. RU38E]SNS63845.1 hypothetical protein SAMN05880591_10529 [Azospirillum sp. RU37A]